MQRIAEIICWAGLGLLALVAIPLMITRFLSSFMQVVLMFVDNPLPWWIRILAAIAVVAGFVYLFKHRRGRWLTRR